MSLHSIKSIQGKSIPVKGDNIDTDQIIPARYLRCVTFSGLGPYAFQDLRFNQKGESLNHPFDQEKYKGASILVSGMNFGCGSSREHAPQSLFYWGIRAVIAVSYAEIFFNNCKMIGIPCVQLSEDKLDELLKYIQQKPTAAEIKIDLEKKQITCDHLVYEAFIPENTRQALVEGKWDPLADLLNAKSEVTSLDKALNYRF
ncbi:MAG: 3-isopropylmalate dehydratase small subunit [Pseudobdellovibrionaceae bacterium]|jgi:3-isopropylmalate/(R)-2-methylmalate dehydratase small subunit